MYAHHLEVNQGPPPFLPADERWPVKRKAFEPALAGGSAIFLLAAREEGEVLGVAFSTIQPPNPILDSGVVGELDTIVVTADARGTGIGEALARRTLDAMRERGAQSVKLSVVPGNDDAVRFYERLGLRTSMLEMMAPL